MRKPIIIEQRQERHHLTAIKIADNTRIAASVEEGLVADYKGWLQMNKAYTDDFIFCFKKGVPQAIGERTYDFEYMIFVEAVGEPSSNSFPEDVSEKKSTLTTNNYTKKNDADKDSGHHNRSYSASSPKINPDALSVSISGGSFGSGISVGKQEESLLY